MFDRLHFFVNLGYLEWRCSATAVIPTIHYLQNFQCALLIALAHHEFRTLRQEEEG